MWYILLKQKSISNFIDEINPISHLWLHRTTASSFCNRKMSDEKIKTIKSQLKQYQTQIKVLIHNHKVGELLKFCSININHLNFIGIKNRYILTGKLLQEKTSVTS